MSFTSFSDALRPLVTKDAAAAHQEQQQQQATISMPPPQASPKTGSANKSSSLTPSSSPPPQSSSISKNAERGKWMGKASAPYRDYRIESMRNSQMHNWLTANHYYADWKSDKDRIKEKNIEQSHYLMNSHVIALPPGTLDEFNALYEADIRAGKSLFVVERPTSIYRVFFDLDLSFPLNGTATVEGDVKDPALLEEARLQSDRMGPAIRLAMCAGLQESVRAIHKTSYWNPNTQTFSALPECYFDMIILSTPDRVTWKSGKQRYFVKFGLHVYFTNIYLMKDQAKFLRAFAVWWMGQCQGSDTYGCGDLQRVREAYTQYIPPAPFSSSNRRNPASGHVEVEFGDADVWNWEEILDMTVFKANGIRMWGSHKLEPCPAKHDTPDSLVGCKLCNGTIKVHVPIGYTLFAALDSQGRPVISRDQHKEIVQRTTQRLVEEMMMKRQPLTKLLADTGEFAHTFAPKDNRPADSWCKFQPLPIGDTGKPRRVRGKAAAAAAAEASESSESIRDLVFLEDVDSAIVALTSVRTDREVLEFPSLSIPNDCIAIAFDLPLNGPSSKAKAKTATRTTTGMPTNIRELSARSRETSERFETLDTKSKEFKTATKAIANLYPELHSSISKVTKIRGGQKPEARPTAYLCYSISHYCLNLKGPPGAPHEPGRHGNNHVRFVIHPWGVVQKCYSQSVKTDCYKSTPMPNGTARTVPCMDFASSPRSLTATELTTLFPSGPDAWKLPPPVAPDDWQTMPLLAPEMMSDSKPARDRLTSSDNSSNGDWLMSSSSWHEYSLSNADVNEKMDTFMGTIYSSSSSVIIDESTQDLPVCDKLPPPSTPPPLRRSGSSGPPKPAATPPPPPPTHHFAMANMLMENANSGQVESQAFKQRWPTPAAKQPSAPTKKRGRPDADSTTTTIAIKRQKKV